MRRINLIGQSVLLAGLLLCSRSSTPAQQPTSDTTNQSKTSEFLVVEKYPLISIDAEVISRTTGSVVSDLKHQEFAISENNIPHVVMFWQHLPAPLSLLILVDPATGYTDYASLENRMDALKTTLSLTLKPEDEVSVVLLDSTPLFLQDYTNKIGLINAALNTALQRKETPLLSTERRFRVAIRETARYATSHNSAARRATILISDLPEKAASDLILPEWLSREVLESDTIFCWNASSDLSLRAFNLDTVSVDKVNILTLVRVTGGEFVSNDWKSFIERLRSRYRIAYTPNTFGRSGEVVKINLEIKPSPTRDPGNLALTYRRLAIVPFSKR